MNLKIIKELDRILKANPSLKADDKMFCQVINGTFNIALETLPVNDLIELAAVIDMEVLSQYFSKVWQPATKKYKYSGLSIVDEINAMKPEAVLDAGCGYNEFKGKIDNLTGIDPYNAKADLMCHIEDYDPGHKFDVAICLGSINFGGSEDIIREMTHVVGLIKQGGKLYFRVNPGEQHDKEEAKWINFYDWDSIFISNISSMLNCEVETLRQDVGNRLYFVLRKL